MEYEPSLQLRTPSEYIGSYPGLTGGWQETMSQGTQVGTHRLAKPTQQGAAEGAKPTGTRPLLGLKAFCQKIKSRQMKVNEHLSTTKIQL